MRPLVTRQPFGIVEFGFCQRARGIADAEQSTSYKTDASRHQKKSVLSAEKPLGLVVGRTEETDWAGSPVTNRVHLYGAESGRDRPTSNEPQLTGQRRRMQGFIFPKPILWA